MTAPPNRLVAVPNLTRAEAEELLDWLENNGYRRRELLCADGETFTVRYARE